MRLAIIAGPRAGALAGFDGSVPLPGAGDVVEALTMSGDALPERDVTVHLPDPGTGGHAPSEIEADAVWVPGPAEQPHRRTIATDGEGLWSRAPWPVRDDLFELQPASEPRVLVVGVDEEQRDSVVSKLEGARLAVTGAALLDAGDLATATEVVLLGHGANGSDAIPAEAPAVLAARRVLIVPRCPVTFGLLVGTDHLAFGHEDEVVQYVSALHAFPESFGVFRTFGAVAAERHRASVVYARLAADITAEAAWASSA